jgi:hypothetical protein
MDRIFRFQLSLASITSALLVTLGNELKSLAGAQTAAYSPLLTVGSILVGILSAPLVLQWLTDFKWFRRRIFGKHWIEGYWYNLNLNETNNNDILTDPAITEISFKSTQLGYETTGHRISNGVDVFTFSQYVVLLGHNNLYINVATSNATTAFRNVFACGYFFRSPGSPIMDTYDGVILYPDGATPYRQRARRIEPKLVKTLVKEYGAGWIVAYLTGEIKDLDQRNDMIRSQKAGKARS